MNISFDRLLPPFLEKEKQQKHCKSLIFLIATLNMSSEGYLILNVVTLGIGIRNVALSVYGTERELEFACSSLQFSYSI